MKHTGGCWSLRDFSQHIFKHLWDFFMGIPDEQFNLGHLSCSFQLGNMVSIDEVRDYLNSLNTMDVIWLGFRLGDQKAKLL